MSITSLPAKINIPFSCSLTRGWCMCNHCPQTRLDAKTPFWQTKCVFGVYTLLFLQPPAGLKKCLVPLPLALWTQQHMDLLHLASWTYDHNVRVDTNLIFQCFPQGLYIYIYANRQMRGWEFFIISTIALANFEHPTIGSCFQSMQ